MKYTLAILIMSAATLSGWCADKELTAQRSAYRQKLESARQAKATAEQKRSIPAARNVMTMAARGVSEYAFDSVRAQLQGNKSLSPGDVVDFTWTSTVEQYGSRITFELSAKDLETIKRYEGSGTPGTPEYRAPNHQGLAMARHDEEKTDKLGVWSRLHYRIVFTIEVDEGAKTVRAKLATISRATGPYPVIEGSAPLAEYRKLVDEYLELFIGAHVEHLAENKLSK